VFLVEPNIIFAVVTSNTEATTQTNGLVVISLHPLSDDENTSSSALHSWPKRKNPKWSSFI